MTREEAIDRLKEARAGHKEFLSVEVIDMAIKGLEQKPCSNAIDRAKAIEIASGYCHPANVTKELAKLPPVTPQPKMGQWRPIYQGDEIIDYRCSECEFGYTFGKSTHGMNYCPYCGAKMSKIPTD